MAGGRSSMRTRMHASMRSISPSSQSTGRSRAWASSSTRARSRSPRPAEDRSAMSRRPRLREDGMKALLAAAALFACAASARADSVEEFYRGKQLQILVGAEVGGGYDINARLVARHIGRHIPGTPSVLPVNLPGGGRQRATNFVHSGAPRDGTATAARSRAIVSMPLMGVEAAKYDPTKF